MQGTCTVSSTVQYHELSVGGPGLGGRDLPGTTNKWGPMVGRRPLMIEVRTCVQLNVNYDKLKNVNLPALPTELFAENLFQAQTWNRC